MRLASQIRDTSVDARASCEVRDGRPTLRLCEHRVDRTPPYRTRAWIRERPITELETGCGKGIERVAGHW